MELENKMLIDGYWFSYGDERWEEKVDERFEYEDDRYADDWLDHIIEEEEEEEEEKPFFAWSRENDGYHF
jgi:hypothetical protein